ncbi:pinin [Marchantia polymorpha subsp. ruderalis]|uniref:Pinin/SDK/MemA protein domain-containing protein n=2 Tax=Marchantia polymorpha TaxID=3197 RepID=A0AAF6B529_MARPO|nr:hypothetical protein MARPO_0066s0029 [Marchantia polymorpha]BBN07113.1 hypothetical protein Mp_4g01130 [Marchantia polymorpha subsp. ruderalis]|eukprot:PTQ36070.1 hypothetical protein MARPO_0066s0029 [Marchantia polymorpha]
MEGTMVDVIVEKSADDLRREIDELNRQQRELTERLRDPRGLRKRIPLGAGARGAGLGVGSQRVAGRGGAQRGAVRRGDAIDPEEQPLTKKRLLSAVVKVEGDDDGTEAHKNEEEPLEEKHAEALEEAEDDRKRQLPRLNTNGRRDFRGVRERGFADHDNQAAEPLPRVIPKIDDPNVAKRNRRMFGALLGTLEKFKQEDQKLSGSEAFIRRSTSQKRAEQRAQEESERLRQQEREQLAGKRKRDLVLRARIAAKSEEKQLELLFIQWTDHQTQLCSFLRTKAEPNIFYMPAKFSDETEKLLQARKEELVEWKSKRRAELTEYQKQATAEHLARVESEIEKWQAGTHTHNNDVTGSVAEETEEMEGTGDDERSHGRHGWKKGRVSVASDNVEDHREGILEEAEEGEADGESHDALLKENSEGEDTVDTKDGVDGGALKDVMGYGSGDDEMDER